MPEDILPDKVEEFDPYKHVVCRICNMFLSTIHSHIRYIHKLTIKEYKEKFPNAEIESQEIKDKRKVSVTKSWEGNDERREYFRDMCKGDENPMRNSKTRYSVRKSRRGQTSNIKGCNLDGNPCKNPKCNGRVHPDMTGENNNHNKKIRTDPLYKEFMQEKAEHMRTFVKWTSKPELVVRKAFTDAGIEIITGHNVKGLLHPTPDHPHLNHHNFDIIIPNIKVIVEVHGCYYHGCCTCLKEQTLDYIHNKIGRYQYDIVDNIRKDEEIAQQVSESDWKLVVIWEHEVAWVQNFVKSLFGVTAEMENISEGVVEHIPLS